MLSLKVCRLSHGQGMADSCTPSLLYCCPDARLWRGCCRATHLFMHNIFGAQALWHCQGQGICSSELS